MKRAEAGAQGQDLVRGEALEGGEPGLRVGGGAEQGQEPFGNEALGQGLGGAEPCTLLVWFSEMTGKGVDRHRWRGWQGDVAGLLAVQGVRHRVLGSPVQGSRQGVDSDGMSGTMLGSGVPAGVRVLLCCDGAGGMGNGHGVGATGVGWACWVGARLEASGVQWAVMQ